MGKVCVQLVAMYTFHAGEYIKPRKEVKLSKLLARGVSPRSEESWNDLSLNMPGDILSSFQCGCIGLNYRLDVYVEVHLATKLRVSFPITVSNSPEIVSQQPGTSSSSTITGLSPSQAYQSLQVSDLPQAHINKTVIEQPGVDM